MVEAAGLYLHVPFCSTICPYCDFAVTRSADAARERFTAALIAEIGRSAATALGPFDTVYLGGGTPSSLGSHQLQAILRTVRRELELSGDAFLIMEANPEDVTASAVETWRSLGIEGLSLGVQSFDDRVLRSLGRRHRGEQARRAVESALRGGFPWVSLDLIYGSPGTGVRGRPGAGASPPAPPWDPLAVALADVEVASGLEPHHLSCYQLTVHDGTPFAVARARGQLRELSGDRQATLFLELHAALAAAGYPAYEVSSFARGPEHRSRHNTKYWRHVPYLGLGPSAHSFDGTARWWNRRDFGEWAAAIESGDEPVAGSEMLGAQQLALEAVMLGLRTADGIVIDRFRERHGVDLLTANRESVARAIGDGLLRLDAGRLAPTTRGMAVADALAASFAVS